MGQYLLKIFENEQYQNDFMNGKLYMNTLKFFKKNESLDIARSDKLETIKEHKQQIADFIEFANLSFLKDKGEITGGTITEISKKFDYCSILCFYSLWKNTEDEQIVIDERNKRFGEYCIVITDIKEFLNRVVRATDKNKFVCHHMKVNYINKNLEYKIKEKEVPFTKFDNFNYQREFRVAINTKRNMNQHYILEVGSLKDIAFISTIYKINDDLNLK